MPLNELPINRDRGCSVDSLNSMDDFVVFPGSGGIHPRRQPHNAPSETRAQTADGFARFLKQHSSPTHQRVTAGGRIVPMERMPAPPQFNLLIDSLGSNNKDVKEQKAADVSKIGANRPMSTSHITKATANNAIPSTQGGENPKNPNSSKVVATDLHQKAPVSTGVGILKKEDSVPRPSDLTHMTSANTTGLPQTFYNITSPIHFHPQILPQNQLAPLAFTYPGMVLNPVANMQVTGADEQPVVSAPIIPNAILASGLGVDQMNLPINQGQMMSLGLHGVQPDSLGNFQSFLPFYGNGTDHLAAPSGVPFTNDITAFGPSQNLLGSQIGMPLQAGFTGQMLPAQMMSSNIDLTNLAGVPNSVKGKITEADVKEAENAFNELDKKLRSLDQYTASHHSKFTHSVKSHYVNERMKIVEDRDMARQKWMRVREVIRQEKLGQSKATTLNKPHQPNSMTTAAASASAPKNGNSNFNVQAAAWVPGQMHNGHGTQPHPHPVTSALVNHPPTNKSACHFGNNGVNYRSFAERINHHGGNSFVNKPNHQHFTSSGGPMFYGTRKMSDDFEDDELSNPDVDEWGVRKGNAPPEIAQRQSEEEMKLLAQKRGLAMAVAADLAADAKRFQDEEDLTTDATGHPVDDWGVRLGRAPPELARQQSKQDEALKKLDPDQRSRTSLAAIDRQISMESQFTQAQDDKSSLSSVDASECGTMTAGEAPVPTKADWQAITIAMQKEKGVKTEIHLATGAIMVIEGTGASANPFTTVNDHGKSFANRQQQSKMSQEEQTGIGKELVRIEKEIGGFEDGLRKSGGGGFNIWANVDENDFFRHKGPSSVALQSVNVQGRMPGFDGAVDRNANRALKPMPTTSPKVNSSSLKAGSPTKRFIKNIWNTTPKRAHFENEEEDMGKMHKTMYHY
jgi:hypothetical protein